MSERMNGGKTASDWIETAREWNLSVECTHASGETALFTCHGETPEDWSAVREDGPDGPVTVESVMNAIMTCDPDVRLRETQAAIREIEN